MKFRMEHNYSRNDFLQLLMELRNKGTVCDPEETVEMVEEIAEGGKCIYGKRNSANKFGNLSGERHSRKKLHYAK